MSNHDSSKNNKPDNGPTDEQILEYEQSIRDNQAKTVPLVNVDEDILQLLAEYAAGSKIFQTKIQKLSAEYDRIRRCRGDGNCFFRAFAYSWYENIMLANDPDLLNEARQLLLKTSDLLKDANFEPLAYEDFYDVALETLDSLPQQNSSTLLSIFQTDHISNAIVVHFRFITSAYLKLHAEEYLPFIDYAGSMDQFCSHYVEAMGMESDQIHIIALTKVLDTPVQVVYLDGSNNTDSVVFHNFEVDHTESALSKRSLVLLYRPGHYDILYKKQ
ncbi:cysteine proteinase [Basidiobolus meristosporus CBS 931.73]|uniref:ubiquitinyl hydrolase 1 n=1 Tax=Basidiobolus meristosporus CBS 931.73 TaxID=1314790 RepID=A0A1Y1XTK5_9FUNG|nr:cysteine proteinase [Basidiobolus meristosporus CBS 931.73]|eukprot:ORX89015.1 cysteine proteinase [Basidiobolus meristosporus CBS 931.73]